ncbi:MAG: MFS transporter [Chloroflexi bacterium]|nr:MFS transporter [Chloroflexota bacterium]
MLSDLHFRGRRRPVLVIIVVLTLLGMLMAAAMPPDAPWLYALVLAALLGASAFGWTGVLGTLVIETAGRGPAATAVALVSTLGSPGSVLGPPIFGFIVDQTGSYRAAWLSAAGVVCLGLLALARVSERSLQAGLPEP